MNRAAFLIGVVLLAVGIYQVSRGGLDRAIGILLLLSGAYLVFTFRKISIA